MPEGYLNKLAEEIREINRANGWNIATPTDWSEAGNKYRVPAILMLITSEVAEALEAYRHDDRENFAEELADTLIRVLDLVAGLQIDIDRTVAAKLEVNRSRGFRHGGKKV